MSFLSFLSCKTNVCGFNEDSNSLDNIPLPEFKEKARKLIETEFESFNNYIKSDIIPHIKENINNILAFDNINENQVFGNFTISNSDFKRIESENQFLKSFFTKLTNSNGDLFDNEELNTQLTKVKTYYNTNYSNYNNKIKLLKSEINKINNNILEIERNSQIKLKTLKQKIENLGRDHMNNLAVDIAINNSYKYNHNNKIVELREKLIYLKNKKKEIKDEITYIEKNYNLINNFVPKNDVEKLYIK